MNLLLLVFGVVLVGTVYSTILFFIPQLLTPQDAQDFWGTLPSVWDHPEKNFT